MKDEIFPGRAALHLHGLHDRTGGTDGAAVSERCAACWRRCAARSIWRLSSPRRSSPWQPASSAPP
jgi:hypothetical protein